MRFSTMNANTTTSPPQPTVILLHGLLRKAKCMEKLRKCVARHKDDRAPPPPTASLPLALRYQRRHSCTACVILAA